MRVPFKAQGHLDWPSLGERSLPATFLVPGTPPVTVRLAYEEVADTSRLLMMTAEASFEPPDPVLTNLQDMAGLVSLDERALQASDETLAFGLQVGRELRQAANRVVRVLAWRVGDPLITSSVNIGPSEFRLGETWDHVPMRGYSSLLFSQGTQLTPAQIEDANNLLARDLSEPLAHTVWREAWRLREQSPRGSIFLGASALEIGIKEFIAGRVPDADWLVQEAPTPPLMRLLQEYLPKLTKADPKPFPQLDEQTQRRVARAVRRRNDVAHSSKDPLTGEELKATLHALRKVIYMLDEQDGHGWTDDQEWFAN